MLEPLWLALQDHHAAIAPVLGHAAACDRPTSWARRRAKYARWMDDPDTFALVAERDGRPIGYAFVTVGPGYASWASGRRIAELETLSVLPEERGGGVGTALVDAVGERLRAAGVRDLSVTSATANVDSHRFYERRGLTRAFVVFFGEA